MIPRRTGIVACLVCLCATILPRQSAANFREEYDSALQSYQAARTEKEIRGAVAAFERLMTRNDAGILKANLYYWCGECWYDLKEYLKALNSFERALLYPQSNKEEVARFKVATCCIRLGWGDTAGWELRRFLRDYPASSLAPRARQELQKLSQGAK